MSYVSKLFFILTINRRENRPWTMLKGDAGFSNNRGGLRDEMGLKAEIQMITEDSKEPTGFESISTRHISVIGGGDKEQISLRFNCEKLSSQL